MPNDVIYTPNFMDQKHCVGPKIRTEKVVELNCNWVRLRGIFVCPKITKSINLKIIYLFFSINQKFKKSNMTIKSSWTKL